MFINKLFYSLYAYKFHYLSINKPNTLNASHENEIRLKFQKAA